MVHDIAARRSRKGSPLPLLSAKTAHRDEPFLTNRFPAPTPICGEFVGDAKRPVASDAADRKTDRFASPTYSSAGTRPTSSKNGAGRLTWRAGGFSLGRVEISGRRLAQLPASPATKITEWLDDRPETARDPTSMRLATGARASRAIRHDRDPPPPDSRGRQLLPALPAEGRSEGPRRRLPRHGLPPPRRPGAGAVAEAVRGRGRRR